MTRRLLARLAAWPLWDALGERCNAILAKEVRQALRGRYFMIAFWLALSVATVIGTLMLAFLSDSDQASGTKFFLTIFGCLAFAVNVFVPFSAFASLGNEWDENTFDLLILSNLRPSRIAWGKLQSSIVQTLLFFFGFLPFLAFAFLLRGLDLPSAARWLVFVFGSSATLSAVALLLSSLTRIKIARVLLMAFLAVILVWVTALSTVLCVQDLTMGWGPLGREPWLELAGFASLCLFVGGFSVAFVCTRLAHPEENRSSAPRVLGTVTLFVLAGWMAYAYHEIGDPELLWVFSLLGILGASVLGVLFASEPERLGRRVRLQVPRRPLWALLAAPWFPGGGRGFLLFLVHLGLIALSAIAVHALVDVPRKGDLQDGAQMLATVMAYFVVWLGLPTALLARWTGVLSWRVVARVAVPGLAFLGFFVPTLIAFLLEAADPFSHLGNPVWTMFSLERDHLPAWAGWSIVLGAALVLLLNAVRMVRGVREMLAVSSARRGTVAAARSEPALPAEGDPDAVPGA